MNDDAMLDALLPGAYVVIEQKSDEVVAARVRIGPREILDLMSGCDEGELRAQGRFWEIGQRRREWRAIPVACTLAEARAAIACGDIPSKPITALSDAFDMGPLVCVRRRKAMT